eukprot:gene8818-768_t
MKSFVVVALIAVVIGYVYFGGTGKSTEPLFKYDPKFNQLIAEKIKKNSKKTGKIKVGIIGGGIAGTSNSMFLKDFFQDDINIKIFEKLDRLGGRTWSFKLPDGTNIDIGGTSIVEQNRYAMEFKDKFKMDFADGPEGVSLSIWDNLSKKLMFEEKSGFLSDLKNLYTVLKNYNIFGPFKTNNVINGEVWKIMKVYEQQDNLMTWNSPWEMFESVGLTNLMKITLNNYFIKTNMMHSQFAKDFVVPICLNNYLQNSSISAFGGLISSVALVSNFHRFQKGADGFAKNLAKNSTAEISLNTVVKTIKKDKNGIIVESKSCEECKIKSETFDKIVLASPLELSNIEFIGFDFKVKHKLEFRQTHVTFVKGYLKEELFGLDSSINFHDVLFNENGNPDYISFSVEEVYDDHNLYKVFSTSERSDEFINHYFTKVSWKFKHWFYAYPMLKPISKDEIQPSKLDENLYYINSMEAVVSTMETEMLSSKNIALLLAKDWYGKE